jgi:hypothetical protein
MTLLSVHGSKKLARIKEKSSYAVEWGCGRGKLNGDKHQRASKNAAREPPRG